MEVNTIPLKKILKFEKGKNPKDLVKYPPNSDYLPYLEADYFRTGNPSQYALCDGVKIADNNDLIMIFDGSKSGEIFRNIRKGIIASTMVKLLFDSEKYDSYYIQYFVQYYFLVLNDGTTGSGIPHLNQDTFFGLQLPDFKLKDQQKVASEIKSKLTLIEQIQKASISHKEAVVALQQKQLDEILSLDKLKNLKFKKLKDYHAEISAGKAVSSVGGYYTTFGVPYLQVNNIDNERGFIPNKIVYISEESHKALNKSEILKDDVLINIVGPPIGKICWYPNEEPANINQAVVRVRCPEEINFKFLTYLLRTSHFYNHFVEVKVGSRQWNVSSKNIGDLLIPEIPIDKQLELVKEIESKNINQLKLQIFKQLESIEALPAAILREVFDFKTN